MDDDANVAEHAEQQPMEEVAPEEFAPEAEAVDNGGDGVDGMESADGRHGGEQEEEYPPEEAMHDGEDELYADAEPQEGTGDVHVGDEAPEGEAQDGDGETGNRRQQDEEYDTAADYANGEAAVPDAAPDAAVEAAGDDDAAAPPATRAKNEDNTPLRCMYVGNLSFKTDEITLAQECERYGQVRHVKLVKDKETGLPKGFAFVTFISPRGCEAACTGMRSRELDGRNLRVEAALGHKFDGNEKDGYFPPSQPEYRTQQLPPRLNSAAGPREERANSRPEEAPRAGRGGSNGGGGDDAHSSSRPEARAERRSRDERLNGRDEPRGGGGGAAASARGDAPRDGEHHHRRGSGGGGEEYAREAQRERGGGFARERSDARGDRGDRERAELTLRERERELERQRRAFEAAAAAAAAAAQAAREEPISRERSVYSGSFADMDRRERDRPAARSMPVYERGPPERHPSRGAYPPIREDSRERERARYEAERMAAPLRRADSRDALRDDLYAPAHDVRRPTPLYVEGRDRGEVRYPEYEKPVALAPSDAPAYRGPPRGGYADRSPPRAYARPMHDDPSPPSRYRASRRGASRERDYSPPPQQRAAVAPAYERQMYAERERYAERDFGGGSRGGGGGGYAPERGGSGGGSGGYERTRFPPRAAAAAAPAPAPQPAVVRAATLPPSMIPSNADARTVFVGNIGTNITPEKLMTTFQRCGRIESVRIRSEKGFGFITFETKEAAKDAIRFFDKMELEGRTLKVAPPTPVRPGQPVVSDRPIIVPQRPVSPYGPERHMGGRMDRRAEYQRPY